MHPQQGAREHHRRSHQLSTRDEAGNPRAGIATQKGEQETGKTTQEEPRTQDLSIVMRPMQQPEQQDEKQKFCPTAVDLRGVEGNAERGSGRSLRAVEDNPPGQIRRDPVVASRFQATDGNDGTTQRQAGSKSIGCPPEGEPEAPGIGRAEDDRDRRARKLTAKAVLPNHAERPRAVLRPIQQDQQNPASQERGDNGEQSQAPDFVSVERKQPGRANADQQGKHCAQGEEKSISRQDEAAELEEMRVHERSRRNRPTGPCHSALVNPS